MRLRANALQTLSKVLFHVAYGDDDGNERGSIGFHAERPFRDTAAKRITHQAAFLSEQGYQGEQIVSRVIRLEPKLPDDPLLYRGPIPGLGSGLDGLPPGAVLGVPGDGLVQALGEVRVLGRPAQLAAELGAVDGVAAVVAGAVAHPVEVVDRPPHALQDRAQHVDVGLLAVGADEVGFAHLALGEDGPHGARVVIGVDPVAHVAAVAVELGAHAVQDVGDLARDELLHVLVGAVVVGAVGDGGAHAERAVPGAHQVVGGSLGGAVGVRGTVRRLLGEARGVVQR